MPSARRVVTRSPHRSVGIIACSWLQDEAIEYESQLERTFVHIALTCSAVKKIAHQPFKIEYELGGKALEYTPDFLCTLKDGTKVVVEVKPEKFVKKDRAKFEKAKAILAKSNIPFAICTDKQLRKGKTAANAALILRYARAQIPDSVRSRALTFAGSHDTPLSLLLLTAEASLSIQDVLHLIGRGDLTISTLDQALEHAVILLPHKDTHHGTLFFCNWLNAAPW